MNSNCSYLTAVFPSYQLAKQSSHFRSLRRESSRRLRNQHRKQKPNHASNKMCSKKLSNKSRVKRLIFLNVDQNDFINMRFGEFSCNWPGDNGIRGEN